jgi:hypothetical protein
MNERRKDETFHLTQLYSMFFCFYAMEKRTEKISSFVRSRLNKKRRKVLCDVVPIHHLKFVWLEAFAKRESIKKSKRIEKNLKKKIKQKRTKFW